MKVNEDKIMKKNIYKIVLIISVIFYLLFMGETLYYRLRMQGCIWTMVDDSKLKFTPYGYWSCKNLCSEGCCNYAPGNSDRCPFYIVLGNKVIAYGIGIDVMEIKDISEESITLVMFGSGGKEEYKFANLSHVKDYGKEDREVVDIVASGHWKSGNIELKFNEYIFYRLDRNKSTSYAEEYDGYFYQVVNGKTIEVEHNDVKEQINIVKIDEKEMVLEFDGKEYSFVNTLYRPADWFSEGYFCTCDKCMTILNGYDNMQGIELVKSASICVTIPSFNDNLVAQENEKHKWLLSYDLKVYMIEKDKQDECTLKEIELGQLESIINRKRTTGCFWIENDKVTKIVIPRLIE